MKKKVLISLVFIIILIGINYISDNNNFTKTISYNGNNLRISIDGEVSNTLPTSGNYYLVDYDCKSSSTELEWDKKNYKLNISNGTKKGGVTCNLEFKSKPLLGEMPVGSYIAYTGNNNCDNTDVNGWTSCKGKNANYVNDTEMGYCNSPAYKFHVNGWRLAYVENDSPHLISAGATDCMCTSSKGQVSDTSCSGSLTTYNLSVHFNNMNAIALKYCNKDFANGGICDVTTSWAMKAKIKENNTDVRETSDFKKITGNNLSGMSCVEKYSNISCGYTNDLIDNGGYYWVATPYNSDSANTTFIWMPSVRFFYYGTSGIISGVRPVLALESSIVVVEGEGTYESPYLIDNNYFSVNIDDVSATILLLHSIEENVSMCISVDTSVCTNYINYSDTYTLDLSSYNIGEHIIYVYYRDNNGKIVASMNRSVNFE